MLTLYGPIVKPQPECSRCTSGRALFWLLTIVDKFSFIKASQVRVKDFKEEKEPKKKKVDLFVY